ncbi:hypothetical protein [Caldovatus aquaticus]|nr:hypothetical protein [Caldovatus aquaticus]
MKAILTGILAAVILALAAAVLLDTGVQRYASDAYRTEGVRL